LAEESGADCSGAADVAVAAAPTTVATTVLRVPKAGVVVAGAVSLVGALDAAREGCAAVGGASAAVAAWADD
jgi:hypothetical protein